MKTQLAKSWEREFHIKSFVKTITSMESKKIEYKIHEINTSFAKVREEVEMW